MATRVSYPKGLDDEGRALWKAVAGNYALRPDERRILEDACRTADVISKIEHELDGADLTVRGSQGQPVPNGHLAELRQYRATLAKLLSSLKLPDDGADEGDTSHKALKAAESRWARSA